MFSSVHLVLLSICRTCSRTPPQVALFSFFNAAQTYTSVALTRRVYPNAAASALTARLFGTWTAVQGVVRLFAAHHVTDPVVYRMAFATYAIAAAHFGLELLVYRTTEPVSGATPTYFVAVGTLVWMWSQWEWYIGSAA